MNHIHRTGKHLCSPNKTTSATSRIIKQEKLEASIKIEIFFINFMLSTECNYKKMSYDLNHKIKQEV